MPVGDTPQMLAAAYQNNTYNTQQLMGGAAFISNSAREQLQGLQLQTGPSQLAALDQLVEQAQAHRATGRREYFSTTNQEEIEMPSRRIVQVYIADPSDAVPLKDAVLYTGEQKMTDLTDQELFFELDIKTLLEAHNAKRTKLVDKKIKDRTEYLEPAKVRDLKMVVVTVASF